MPARSSLSWFPLLAAAFALGCQPHIGDECSTSVDCSQGGERLCDITQPGGYCTVFNCEPDGCPDDSVCIAFGARLPVGGDCTDANGFSRFQRTFCMASCKAESDCRGGYACIDVGAADNPWGAVVVDRGASGRVCVVPKTASASQAETHDVCEAGGVAAGSGGAAAGAAGTQD